jgi:hypothetical protein
MIAGQFNSSEEMQSGQLGYYAQLAIAKTS